MSHASRHSAALAALRRGRAPGGRTGARGIRRAARPLVLAAAAALVGLAGVSRPAHAFDYQACLGLADQLHRGCLNKSDSWIGDRACDWIGGVAIIGCAAAEALRHFSRGVAAQ